MPQSGDGSATRHPSPGPPRLAGPSPLRLARIAGLLYLTIFLCGLFAEMVVRSRIFVPGDPGATARNLLASEGLFRAGLLADLTMVLCDVALAAVLYLLFRPVSRALSLVAAGFRLAQASVLGLNLLNHLMAVQLLTGDGYGASLSRPQLDALAFASLDAHRFGYLIGLVLFAAHLAILAVLVWRSNFLPRLLGLLLGFAALGYLVDSASYFLVARYDGALSPVAIGPAVVGELALLLWLLVRGVRSDGRAASEGDALPVGAGA